MYCRLAPPRLGFVMRAPLDRLVQVFRQRDRREGWFELSRSRCPSSSTQSKSNRKEPDGEHHLAARAGADGNDFARFVREIRLPRWRSASFFRTRRSSRWTINGGMRIARLVRHHGRRDPARGRARRARLAGLDRGLDRPEKSAARRPSGWCSRDSRRAVRSRCTPACAIRAHRRIMALSTYVPVGENFPRRRVRPTARPIFMAHGTYDPSFRSLGRSNREAAGIARLSGRVA